MNYLKIIALSDLTRMMNMMDYLAICVETRKILWCGDTKDSDYFLEKEFTKLICISSRMILYLFSSKLIYVMGVYVPLTCDTKDPL